MLSYPKSDTMTVSQTLTQRVINQCLSGSKFKRPADVVSWMVAMQAQEYAMAKWAIGLRLPGSTDQLVEKAFNEGAILRTHIMRPTWHFVSPADIRWIIALTGPRIHAMNKTWYKKLELDQKNIRKIKAALEKIMTGRHLTRQEIKDELQKKKIVTDGLRMGYILMHAELDSLICSGPRKAKQFTYALMDERVPAEKKQLKPDEALAKLCTAYFNSRGPASIPDFVKWSGLTVKDAKAGIAMMDGKYEKEKINGQEYIFNPNNFDPAKKFVLPTFLMPDYDEYGMSYKDRSALFSANTETKFREGVGRTDNIVFNRMLIVDGQIAGTWKRTLDKNKVSFQIEPFSTIPKSKQAAVNKAIERFSSFVGKSIEDLEG
jgi:hypothetical protein